MLSPAVMSPFVPSSKKVCVPPPMVERSTLTAATGPGGNAPGVTFRVRSVEVPLAIEAGAAAPTAVGGTPTVDFGDGTPARKSAALSLVSTSPPSWRMAAVVFDSVGAGAGALEAARGPVPDEVQHTRERTGAGQRRRPRDQRDLSARRAHGDVSGGVRGGQRKRAAAAGRLLNEVVPARRNGPVQRRCCPGASGGGCVLHGPTGDADVERLTIAQLDEVILELGAAVATASVNLADDDIGSRSCRDHGGIARCGREDDEIGGVVVRVCRAALQPQGRSRVRQLRGRRCLCAAGSAEPDQIGEISAAGACP